MALIDFTDADHVMAYQDAEAARYDRLSKICQGYLKKIITSTELQIAITMAHHDIPLVLKEAAEPCTKYHQGDFEKEDDEGSIRLQLDT